MKSLIGSDFVVSGALQPLEGNKRKKHIPRIWKRIKSTTENRYSSLIKIDNFPLPATCMFQTLILVIKIINKI